MDEKTRYVFQFRGIFYIDGIMIPEPYASDIRKLLSDEKFVKDYIKTEAIIKNKV